jgi:hypothetical protein
MLFYCHFDEHLFGDCHFDEHHFGDNHLLTVILQADILLSLADCHFVA